MPHSEGRTGNPGNSTAYKGLGRTGTAGNKASMIAMPKRPTMTQSRSPAGRTLAPGNDTSNIIPSRNAGTMQGKTSTPSTEGVPSRVVGKYTHKDSGLLKR